MKKKAIALLLSVLLCGAATAIPASAETHNPPPNVIPAVREWNGASGKFYFKDGMKVVIDEDGIISDAKKKIISEYFVDILGFEVKIVTGEAKAGDIRLSRYTSGDKDVGDEGYTIDADDIVTIRSKTERGFLYGIITLLQSYVSDGYMPKGEAFDVPYYPIRSGMIDVGRAYVPLEYVEEITKYFTWFKLNEIHLHINDNGSDGNGYFRLESDVPGLTSDEHYTKAAYRNYQKRMLDYEVEVVTEIDTPAHSRCFASAVPDYMFDQSHIDITNPDAVKFICDLWDEYVTGDDPVFVSKTVHFGTDEFPSGYNEYMRSYTDTLIKHLRSRGCTPRFWGSFGNDGFNGTTPVSSDAQVNFWALGLSDYKLLFSMGYDVINTCGPVLYCVPGGNYGFADYFDLELLYKSWFVNYMGIGPTTAVDPDNPQLKGACFALWNDLWCDWGGFSIFDIFDRVRYQVCFISEKAWCGEQTREIDAADFVKRFETLSIKTGGSNPGRHEELPITLENADGIKSVGYPYLFTAEINTDEYGVDLMSGTDGRLYINESGKVCFSRESYVFTYDYVVPKNTDVKLQLYADIRRTLLIVDDTWFYDPVSSRNNNAEKGGSTFVLPLEKIGKPIKSLTVEDHTFILNDLKYNTNLALGKNVTVSGLEVDYGLNEPLAVDGRMDTRLSFARDNDVQWMIVDLGKIQTVSKVKIHYFERVSAYEIYVSEDGENYTKVYEVAGLEEGTSDASDEINFDPAKARFIKYVQLKRWFCEPYNTYYSGGIKEFEVFGYMDEHAELLEEAKSIKDSAVRSAYNNVKSYLKQSEIFIPHLNGLYAQLDAAVQEYKNPTPESSEEPSSEESTEESSVAAESSDGEKDSGSPVLPIALGAAAAAVIAGVVAFIVKKSKKK